jgi:tRNA (cytosine38-C5)-methyltransferase
MPLYSSTIAAPAFCFSVKDSIWTDVPGGKGTSDPDPIVNYLDPSDCDASQLLLSDSILLKHAEVLDIVKASSVRSCCFTKAYGRYVEGTGA